MTLRANHPGTQGRRAFVGHPHELVQYGADFVGTRADVHARSGIGQLLTQHRHAGIDFRELVQQRLQALRAEIQFLDQPHGLVATHDQPMPRQLTFLHRLLLAESQVKVAAIALQQVRQGLQVRAEQGQHLFLHGGIGHRDVDRAIEPEFALLNLL